MSKYEKMKTLSIKEPKKTENEYNCFWCFSHDVARRNMSAITKK